MHDLQEHIQEKERQLIDLQEQVCMFVLFQAVVFWKLRQRAHCSILFIHLVVILLIVIFQNILSVPRPAGMFTVLSITLIT